MITGVTPTYVHHLLDSLLDGVPLNFHRQPVPADVRHRIVRAHAAQVAAAVSRDTAAAAAGPPAGDPQPAVATPEPAPQGVALSSREHAVLQGMADGRQNRQIGAALFISEDTVKTHARRLFRKLQARDRAHAVALGIRAGLIK
jgi:two-component system, NarL family, nitrate/nitrite response regulator NarL